MQVQPCEGKPPYDQEQLVEALRVELTSFGVGQVKLVHGATPRERVDDELLVEIQFESGECDPDATELSLTVMDGASADRLGRVIVISDVEMSERPRVVAIAAAELLQASSAEFQASPEPSAEAQRSGGSHAAAIRQVGGGEWPRRLSEGGDALREPARQSARSIGAGWSIEGAFRARVYPSDAMTLLGPEAALRYPVSAWVSLHAGMDLTFGQPRWVRSTPMSAAAVSLGLSAAPGGLPGVELGPRLTGEHTWGGLFNEPGGIAWLMGVALAGHIDLGAGITALVGSEAGYSLVVHQFSPVARDDGVYLGSRIGVAMDP